jgi:hypothetical protein
VDDYNALDIIEILCIVNQKSDTQFINQSIRQFINLSINQSNDGDKVLHVRRNVAIQRTISDFYSQLIYDEVQTRILAKKEERQTKERKTLTLWTNESEIDE